MQTNFGIGALSAVQRMRLRTQALTYRRGQHRGWIACDRCIRRHRAARIALIPEAIAQAHTSYVVLNVVGQPVWLN